MIKDYKKTLTLILSTKNALRNQKLFSAFGCDALYRVSAVRLFMVNNCN